jgi:hypothetical protein
VILDAGDESIRDTRVLAKHLLDLLGSDLLTTRDEDVVESPEHEDLAARLDGAAIAADEVAVERDRSVDQERAVVGLVDPSKGQRSG